MTRSGIRFFLACVATASLGAAVPARAIDGRLPVEIRGRAAHGLQLVAATATPEASGVAITAVISRSLLTRVQGLERIRVALLNAAGKVRAAREVWITPATAGRHDAHAHRLHARLPLRAAAGDRVVVGWIQGSASN